MNQRLNKRLEKIPTSIWNLITQIDELKGKWVGAVRLNPYTLRQLKQSVLITSTGASTRIEGSRMSDEDIEKMLRGISIQTFRDRDKQEVQGYYELLQNVFDSWEQLSFSESLIKHFHKELLKYADKDVLHRGDYKHTENKVEMINEQGQSVGVLFDTTPAYLTAKEMQELVEWTKKELINRSFHPLLVIANFIVEFLQIHPFTDGNGRSSRILTNLLLLKAGYLYMPYVSHEKLIEDNKPEYYLALRQTQRTFKSNDENIIPWLQFFFAVLLEQSKRAIGLLQAENLSILLSPNQRTVWDYLQTVSEVTPKEISETTKVNRTTVNQILTKLLKLQKIERIGMGRTTRYRKI